MQTGIRENNARAEQAHHRRRVLTEEIHYYQKRLDRFQFDDGGSVEKAWIKLYHGLIREKLRQLAALA